MSLDRRVRAFGEFLLPLIWPRAGYWIAKCLVGGGVAILCTPWWLPLAEFVLENSFGWSQKTSTLTTITGFVLIFLGLAVYVWERWPRWTLERLPEVSVLAHFGFLVGEPGDERCFIKITNTSTQSAVVITHIDYVGGSAVPVLTMSLPRRLQSLEQCEAHLPLRQIPRVKSDDLLRAFRVTDSLGRRFHSRPNTDVPPVGYVAK